MFSKQSPHFSQIEITKKTKLRAIDFDEKTKIHCQFCGGKSCKHENWTRCVNPAFKGLHSNWVNDNVVASQRLSDRIIHEFKIIEQFKETGLNAIFNLQEPGEHPYCGDGISMRSGFSYTPELLMSNGISFFNFFWKDLTNPTFERCLNCAQVMDFIIRNGGKCLVHCHAGQGRTALVIGAYLIISGTAKDDKEAIAQTRKNRPKCFSKSYNRNYIKKFYDRYMEIKQIFPSPQNKQSLKEIIHRQSLLFHGEERKYTKFIPKLIFLALNKLKTIPQSQINIEDIKLQMNQISTDQLSKVIEIRNGINSGDWSVVNDCEDVDILLHAVIEFIKSLSNYIIEQQHIEKLQEDIKTVDNYILGFLTSIADLAQLLSLNGTLAQIDDIYSKFTEIIIQSQYQYFQVIQKALKELSLYKKEIYLQEQIKESEDISPIKMQISKSKISDNNLILKQQVNQFAQQASNNLQLNMNNHPDKAQLIPHHNVYNDIGQVNIQADEIRQSLSQLPPITANKSLTQNRMMEEVYDSNQNSYHSLENKKQITHDQSHPVLQQNETIIGTKNISKMSDQQSSQPTVSHNLQSDIKNDFDDDLPPQINKTLKSTQNDFGQNSPTSHTNNLANIDVTPTTAPYNRKFNENEGPFEEIKTDSIAFDNSQYGGTGNHVNDMVISNQKMKSGFIHSDYKNTGQLLDSHDNMPSTAGPSQNGGIDIAQSQQLPKMGLKSTDDFNNFDILQQ
eukprot:403365547